MASFYRRLLREHHHIMIVIMEINSIVLLHKSTSFAVYICTV